MLVVLCLHSTKEGLLEDQKPKLLSTAVTVNCNNPLAGSEESLWNGGPSMPAGGNGVMPKYARYVKFTLLWWFRVG